MEHVLHIFGGGCGEHMIVATLGTGWCAVAVWIRNMISPHTSSIEEPGNNE